MLFVPARPFQEYEVIVAHTEEVGARSVMVTDSLAPVFGTRLTVSLPAPLDSGVSEIWSSLLIADMILLALAAHDENRAIVSSELLTRLRETLTWQT